MPGDAIPPGTLVLGRSAATRVEVSASCLLVVALIAVAYRPRALDLAPDLGGAAWAAGLAVGVLVYAAALLHESAHALVARRHGHPVPTIRLTAAGGRTAVAGRSRTPREETLTALAGPALSLAVGLAALGGRLAVDDGLAAVLLEAVVAANLLFGLFDLLPTPPLDGGRLVRAAAWRATGSPERAARTAGLVGRGVAVTLLGTPLVVGAATGGPAGASTWLVCLLVGALAWAGSSAQLAAGRRPTGADAARPPA